MFDTVKVLLQQFRFTVVYNETLTLGEASTTRAVGTAAGSRGGNVDLLGAQVALTGRAVVDVHGAAQGLVRAGLSHFAGWSSSVCTAGADHSGA